MASVSMDSDSDIEQIQSDDFDVDNMDFDLPTTVAPPTASSSRASGSGSTSQQASGMGNAFAAGPSSLSSGYNSARVVSSAEAANYKHYQVVYPIYIDASRPRKNGERRVANNKAVRFPKAKEIAEICGRFFGLSPVLEPEKTHPRDWANPGRVRVLLKDGKGMLVNKNVPDKYVLLVGICDVIAMVRKQSNVPERILHRLPYHSPALSYGTYEEALKGGGQMQQMMQGMLGGAGGPTPEQEEEQKKRETERELAEKQKIAKMKALQKQGRRMGRR